MIKDNTAISQLGFDPIIGNLPIFAEAALDPYLGEIILFGGNYAPTGWAFAQGQCYQFYKTQHCLQFLEHNMAVMA
ncbi:MAG: tail fiber protein [Nitrosopumilus sp.]|nr:tail fiber protein [Nitrosopumilus sp.]